MENPIQIKNLVYVKTATVTVAEAVTEKSGAWSRRTGTVTRTGLKRNKKKQGSKGGTVIRYSGQGRATRHE